MDSLNYQLKLLKADILHSSLEDIIIRNPVLEGSFLQEYEIKRTKLEAGIPLDYLLNNTKVGEVSLRTKFGNLIPRPETEYLLQILKIILNQEVVQSHLIGKVDTAKIKNLLRKKSITKETKILDLGSGTGLIGASLAKTLPIVVLSDYYQEAVFNSKLNLRKNKLSNKVIKSNLFLNKNLRNVLGADFLLVSNPPYVPFLDFLVSKHRNISFEPNRAIYSGYSGLKLFSKIINQLIEFKLKPKLCFFELDPRNINIAKKISRKISKHSLVVKDLSGLDRFLVF
jgi:HemK-like putative methylase